MTATLILQTQIWVQLYYNLISVMQNMSMHIIYLDWCNLWQHALAWTIECKSITHAGANSVCQILFKSSTLLATECFKKLTK